MRRRLCQEIFPYNPEIESTLLRVGRGRVITENQLEGEMNGLNRNMSEAIGQGENNPQILNPPRVNPPPQEDNQ